MNVKPRPAELPLGDLIDRIAHALPAEVRADYYREMVHCRSLPENDEMLRILRVMQFLTLLAERVPERLVIERERLERLFKAALENLETVFRSSQSYQKQLDRRLDHLPEAVAQNINPEAIAAKINESLHQQFTRSTLPQTARALTVVASEMKETTAKFKETAGSLGGAYRSAASDAARSIEEMESAISMAAHAARLAATELSTVFRREYRGSVCLLTALALVIGLALGILFQRWVFDSQVPEVKPAIPPAVQTEIPIKPKTRP